MLSTLARRRNQAAATLRRPSKLSLKAAGASSQHDVQHGVGIMRGPRYPLKADSYLKDVLSVPRCWK